MTDIRSFSDHLPNTSQKHSVSDIHSGLDNEGSHKVLHLKHISSIFPLKSKTLDDSFTTQIKSV